MQRHSELVVVGAICGGEEALTQAQDLRPQVILIGLDKPGLETITRLRKVLPGAGIIALSLLEGNAYRQAAMAAGADGLVRKGELTTDLLPAIRRVTRASAWCHCQRGENPGWQLHLVAPTPFPSGWTAADSRTPARV